MEAPEVTFVVTDGWQAPERKLLQDCNLLGIV